MSGERQLLVRILGESKGAEDALTRVGEKSSGLKDHMGALGAALGGALAVGGVVDFAKHSVDAFQEVGQETFKLMQLTGANADEASRFRFMAEETGVSVDSLGRALKTMSKQAEAPKGAFQALGIETKNMDGTFRPLNGLMLDVADKFAKMPDGVEKNTLAVKLFGKAGLDMIPMLDRGKQGLSDLEKEASKYGLTLTGSNIDAIKKNLAAHREFHAAIQGLQVQIGEHLLPIITDITRFFAENMPSAIAEVKKVMGDLQPTIDAVGKGFTTLTHVLSDIVDWVKANWQPVVAALGAVLLTVVVPAFVSWAVAAGTAAVATLAAAAPVIALTVAIAAVAFGIVYAYEHFRIFRDTVDAVASFITGTVWPAIKTFADDFMAGFTKIKAVVWPILDELWHVFLVGVKAEIVVLKSEWNIAWTVVSTAVKAADVIVRPIFSWLATTIRNDLVGNFNDLKAGVQVVWPIVSSAISTAWGIIQAPINMLVTSIRAIVQGFNDVVNSASAAGNAISGALSHVPGGGIAKGLLSHLPGFATGGIVPGPIGAPMAAVVHGGEFINPVGGHGAGASYNIVLNGGDATPEGILLALRRNELLKGRVAA